MTGSRVILLVWLLCGVACGQSSRDNALEVTYLANEGFMISMGDTKVLIDALFKSNHYASSSDSVIAGLMDGIPPFDNIDLALVTHDHADHFDAGMMSRFLVKRPAVRFIASSDLCDKLITPSVGGRKRLGLDLLRGQHRSFRENKAEIMVLSLDHSGSRYVSNLAFLVRSNGYTFMHVGDAMLADNEEYLRKVDWSAYNVDLLFIEHFDRSSSTLGVIQDIIKPKHVVLMHVPAGEEESVRAAAVKKDPRAVVFGKELETKRFDE